MFTLFLIRLKFFGSKNLRKFGLGLDPRPKPLLKESPLEALTPNLNKLWQCEVPYQVISISIYFDSFQFINIESTLLIKLTEKVKKIN